MYSFLCAVAWYYVLVTLFWGISAVKDKTPEGGIDTSDINLDIPVISVIYLFYYYLNFLEI